MPIRIVLVVFAVAMTARAARPSNVLDDESGEERNSLNRNKNSTETESISSSEFTDYPTEIPILVGADWKKNNDSENLIEKWEAPDYIRKKFIYYISGYDFDGRPVVVSETGKHNWREVIDQGGEPEKNLIKYWHQFLTRLERWSNQREDREEGIVLVLDFEGFQLKHFNSRASAKFLLHRMEELGTLHDKISYGYVINVNFAAETFINIAKPFLGSIVENFEFFGTRMEKWIPRLLRRIPSNQLPEWYGGEKNFKPVVVYG